MIEVEATQTRREIERLNGLIESDDIFIHSLCRRIAVLEAELDQLRRKAEHGCWGFPCNVCDHEGVPQ